MEKKPGNPTEHLANERTFLAWIRTSIAIMAFGFVVVKFALFVKQITVIMDQAHNTMTLPNKGYSALIGIALVVLGSAISLFAFLRYKSIEKQISENRFVTSLSLSLYMTIAIILISVLLVVYLAPSL